MTAPGTVFLIGAGPGDPSLITIAGLEALRAADVVMHDRLVSPELPRNAKSLALVIDVGKSPGDERGAQDSIIQIMVTHALAGRNVARLKGGDPFVYGRGFEELTACRDAGVPCVVIPGVSSALAAPAAMGVPVTLREVARSVAIVTASSAEDTDAPAMNFAALARIDTVVVLMGRARLGDVVAGMTEAGRAAETPVACVERATTREQRSVVGTLATIVELVERAGLRAPMVTVVGDVSRHAAMEGGYRSPLDMVQALGQKSPLQVGWSDGPLQGKRVLLTRPKPLCRELARALRRLGATVGVLPLIRVTFPHGERPDAVFSRLRDHSWIAFTSASGVRGFSRILAKYGLDVRVLAGCKIAAVGPATANALRRLGMCADLVGDGSGASALAAAIANVARDGARVLYPCGDRAMATLASELAKHGVIVESLVVYRTESVSPSPSDVNRVAAFAPEVAVALSPSTAISAASSGLLAIVRTWLCGGEATAQALRSLGAKRVIVAEGSTPDRVVAALMRIVDGDSEE